MVVDTAWGTEPSRALLEWIDRELKLPVVRLVVTRFHAGRLEGWEVFAERGARIVVSEQTLALARVTSTAACETYRLKPGERRACGTLEIRYPGPAHAPDNVVVWVPAVKLLVGGCAVRAANSGGLGNLSDASVADWSASIARVQAAYPEAKLVLPGHGDSGGPELLAHTRKLADASANAASSPKWDGGDLHRRIRGPSSGERRGCGSDDVCAEPFRCSGKLHGGSTARPSFCESVGAAMRCRAHHRPWAFR